MESCLRELKGLLCSKKKRIIRTHPSILHFHFITPSFSLSVSTKARKTNPGQCISGIQPAVFNVRAMWQLTGSESRRSRVTSERGQCRGANRRRGCDGFIRDASAASVRRQTNGGGTLLMLPSDGASVPGRATASRKDKNEEDPFVWYLPREDETLHNSF